MSILRNIDVAKKYGVSPATVKNWIEYALDDKFQLDLVKIGKRVFIEDSAINASRLTKLKSQGARFRSRSDFQIVEPSPKFYEIFNENEVQEIMHYLEYFNYLPFKYIIVNEGVKWRYELLLDLCEIKPEYKSSIYKISQNLASFVMSLIRDEDTEICLFEMSYDVSPMFAAGLVEEMIKEKVKFKYISVSPSKELHEYRQKFLESEYKISIFEEYIHPDQIDYQTVKKYQNMNSICIFYYPCGALNKIFFDSKVIAHLHGLCRPGLDYACFDVNLKKNSDINSIKPKNNQSSSNLISMHKTYKWFLDMLNLLKICENNIRNYNHNSSTFYRFLSANHNITYRFKTKHGNHDIVILKDTKILYYQIHHYTQDEIFEKVKNLNYDIHSYHYNSGDHSVLFFITPKKSNFLNDIN